MKKLLFIDSVGLLFSCSNNGGTCVCTSTVTGSDANFVNSTNIHSQTVEEYYEKDAQEYCESAQVNQNASDNYFNSTWQANGLDANKSSICELE